MLPDFEFTVTVDASVSPSEDPKKVKEAAANLVLGSKYELREVEASVRLTTQDPRALWRLHEQLRDRHVRGAARRLLLRGTEGNISTLLINRQAASAGIIVLCNSEPESPLGPLFMRIASEQLDQIIQWLTVYGEG